MTDKLLLSDSVAFSAEFCAKLRLHPFCANAWSQKLFMSFRCSRAISTSMLMYGSFWRQS